MLNSVDDMAMTDDITVSLNSTQFNMKHENIMLLSDTDTSNTENMNQIKYEYRDGQVLLHRVKDESNSYIGCIERNTNASEETTIRHFWTKHMVRALIEEYSELIEDFRNPNSKLRETWYELSSHMQVRGYDVSWQMCDKKWRNLKQTFRTIHEDNTRDIEHKRRWEFYEDFLVLFSPEDSVTQPVDPNGASCTSLIGDDSLLIEYDEHVHGSLNENIENLDFDSRVIALNTLIETSNTSNISNIIARSYLSVDDPTTIQTSQNAEFLLNDGVRERDNLFCEHNEQMPTWFKDFIEQYHNDENRRLEALQKMHNESLEIEKKKVALLESLLEKLN